MKTKLDLSVRTYICTMCGLVLDRNLNDARNLAALGEAMVAGSGPQTINGRGGVGALALPVKRQPGPHKRVTPGLSSRKAGLLSEHSPEFNDATAGSGGL